MNWRRAKSILIVSFIFLNVLLSYQLWDSKMTTMDAFNENIEGFSEETRRWMDMKDIRIQGEIPKEPAKLSVISVRPSTNMRLNEKIMIDPPYQLQAPFHESEWKRIIAKPFIDKMEEYQFDLFAGGVDNTKKVHQSYETYPLFEVNLELFIDKDKIVAYNQNYVEVQPGAEENIISAYTAIGSLVEHFIPNNAYIMEVKLGYHGQLFNSDTQYLAPYWRIITSDGRHYYVHGITGSVETPQKEIRK